MEPITIYNSSYYLCTDLFKNFKDAFTGCKGRDVIKKKKLLESDYIYAYETKSGWKLSSEDYSKAKILISTKWKGFKSIELNNTLEPSNETSTSSSSSNDTLDNTNVLNHSIVVVDDKNKYPIAPDILDIEEDEKFKDANGQSIDITIRGEREYDKCYFRVIDVSRGFEMPNLDKNIKDIKSSFDIEIDYKFFTRNSESDESKNETYLTYNGMMKVLYGSHSKNARSFQDWATKTLFTVQLGTEDSKYELVKSIHAVKEAFKTSSDKTPCVYLFVIGNANNLLATDKYTKDTMVYKFGKTDNLPRRSGEHERDFKKMFKIDHIELMLFSVIDPKYITDAENSLKKFFENHTINYENKEELIILDKLMYTSTIQHYKLIKNSYIGCYKEMQDKINQLKRKIKEIQYEYDLTKEKLTNANTLQTEKHKNEIQQKENELSLLMEKYNNLKKN
jgi:hypothetical protein